MKLFRALAPAWLMLAGLAAFSVWARPHLPDAPLAVHFNARFEPDSYWPRDRALAAPVVIGAAVLAAFSFASRALPPRGALERSARACGAAGMAIVGFLFAVQVGVVGRALGWPVDLARTLPVALGALLMLLGNYLGKVRYNLVFGIRTPWTLANERIWDRTHRFAAPLFMVGGLCVAVCGLAAPGATPLVAVAGGLGPALAAAVYSFVLWTRLPEDEKGRIRAGA